jgi:hypothetical protein
MLRRILWGLVCAVASVATKATYVQLGQKARQATINGLTPVVGAFTLTEWSNRVFEAMWPDPHFGDWRRIDRRFQDPDRLDVAVWVGKRLVGMGLVRSDGDAVVLEFVEADPAPDCPLKGSIVLILLDVATNYAQIRGKHRLHVQPMNSGLISHYEKFGFSSYPKNVGSSYMWKKL